MKLTASILIGALLCQLSFLNEAQAGLRGIPLDVAVRDEDKEILKGLPKKIGDETRRALEGALVVLDKNVLKYLELLDRIIERNVAAAGCNLTGAFQNGAAKFGDVFTPGEERLTQNLRAYDSSLRENLGESSTPAEFAMIYADIAQQASEAACRVIAANPENIPTANEVRDVYWPAHRSYFLWARLKQRCKGPYDCLDVVYQETKKMVERPGELDTKEMSEKLSEIEPLPKASWFKEGPSIVYFETKMSHLVSIQRAIELNKFKRKHQADVQVERLEAALASCWAQLARAQQLLAVLSKSGLMSAKKIAQEIPACLAQPEASEGIAIGLASDANERLQFGHTLSTIMSKLGKDIVTEADRHLEEIRNIKSISHPLNPRLSQ